MHFFKTILGVATLFELAMAFNGDATFFNPGLGACGVVNSATDLIAALSPAQFASRAACGRSAAVTFQGKTVVVKIVDLCPGCNSGNIDLSPSAFSILANQTLDRIPVTWNFI